MPLVKCSVEQLEAAQRLYEAASAAINTAQSTIVGEPYRFDPIAYSNLVKAVDLCKMEFEKHGS